MLQVEYERVVSAVYEEGFLYLLVTRNPLSSSGVLLFSLSLDAVDSTLDNSTYYNVDDQGLFIKVYSPCSCLYSPCSCLYSPCSPCLQTQQKINCAVPRAWPAWSECVENVTSRTLVLTALTTDVRYFALLHISNHTLFYLASCRF